MVVRTRLGIDFGTSNTVAVLRLDDGTLRPLLFDGSPSLPSAVCRQPDGALLVGRDAIHTAQRHPDAFEPNPKRLVDEPTVLLGTAELPVTDLIAAVLRRVHDEAVRVGGGEPSTVVLTHPVAWAAPRREVLLAAAARAGLGPLELVAEPVAAASHFARHLADVTGTVVVYDLGAGTFDASVLRRTADGFAVLATDGRTDIGGLDLDERIVRMIGESCGHRDPAAWARLTAPVDADDQRAARQLWDDVRSAKEILSRAATTFVSVPSLGFDVPIGRPQFDNLVLPLLTETVDATARVIATAGAGDPAAVLLVGGSSRIPLVATLLHRRFRVAPTVLEQPELVVALGSVVSATVRAAPTAPLAPEVAVSARAVPPEDPPADPAGDPTGAVPAVSAVPAGAKRIDRRTVVTAGVLGGPIVAVAVGVGLWRFFEDKVSVTARGGLAGTANVQALAYSPIDDNLIAAGEWSGGIRFFDAKTRRPDGDPLAHHRSPVNAIAFSPDGRTVASADVFGEVQIWDVATRSPVSDRLPAGHGSVNTLAFSADGALLAIGGGATTVMFWHVANRAWDGIRLAGHREPVFSAVFNRTGSVVTTGADHTVRMWDVATRSITGQPMTGHTDRVNVVAFHPDGRMLASGGADHTVRLWDASTRAAIGDPIGHAGEVHDLLFTPDGKTLVTCSLPGRVTFWDTADRTKLGDGINHDGSRIALDRAGRTLAVTFTGGIQLYDISR
jgi:hypothetical protein